MKEEEYISSFVSLSNRVEKGLWRLLFIFLIVLIIVQLLFQSASFRRHFSKVERLEGLPLQQLSFEERKALTP